MLSAMTATTPTNEMPASVKARLLFADDHHLVLDALAVIMQSKYDVQVVDSLRNFETAVDTFAPDLAILDIEMPDGDAVHLTEQILAKKPEQKIIFLSKHTDRNIVRRALDTGAQGYVPKRASGEELLRAIEMVLNGEKYSQTLSEEVTDQRAISDTSLTSRQKEVLRLIANGCSAKDIANELNISVRTAEFHRAAIMDRLKLHSTAMMTRYALENGLA